MPSLQDIESLKKPLNEIGNEPEILAELGEDLEDVSAPQAVDFSSLFDDEPESPGSEAIGTEQEPPPETASPAPEALTPEELMPVEPAGASPAADVGEALPDIDPDDGLDISGIFPGTESSPETPAGSLADEADSESVQPPAAEAIDESFDDTIFDTESYAPLEGIEEPAPFDEPDSSQEELSDELDFDPATGPLGLDAPADDGVDATPASLDAPTDLAPEEFDLGEVADDFDIEAPTDEIAADSIPDDIDASASAGTEFDFDTTDADVDTPDVDFDAPEADFDTPDVDFGQPTVEQDQASTEIASDDFDLGEVPVDDEPTPDDFDIDFPEEEDASASYDDAATPDEVAAEESSDSTAEDFSLPDFDFDIEESDEATTGVSLDEASESDFEESDDGDENTILPEEFGFDDTLPEPGELADESADDAEEFTVPDEFAIDEPEVAPSEGEGESAEEFSFDDFSTFDESIPKTGVGQQETIAADESDIDDDVLDAPDEDDFDLTDEVTEELPSEEELNPALAVGGRLPRADEGLDLTSEQFENLTRTLDTLPRNLRLVVEELVGEDQIGGEDLRKLIDALVRGRSPKDIAAITSAITGEKIAISAQYEKRTGLEFEEERDTFAYLFRHTILPVLRIVGAGVAGLALIGYLGYELVYEPIRATGYYRKGYESLELGNYLAANESFDRGLAFWVRKPWFYRYADGFAERRRDDLAADKYEQLLERFRDDRKGLLDFARLETFDRARYEHAEELLTRVVSVEKYDYDGRLLLGDTYMEWALEDPAKYSSARLQYAMLFEQYGNRDEVMFRMLRYFMRTGKTGEVDRLTEYFQGLERVDLNTAVYAELGGHLVDRSELEDVEEVLFRTLESEKSNAAAHYHLARYYRKVEDLSEEDKALTNAFGLLSRNERVTVEDERMLIDTIARQGEVDYRRGQYLEAQSKFIDALDLYEDALQRGRLSSEAAFGRIYAALGDIFYYAAGQTEPALINYTEAERNDFVPPDLRYKIGNILYRDGDHEAALLKFYQAAGDYSANPNLMYATANTLYERNDYWAAQGYYLHVLDVLETQRRNIPIIRPEERSDHRALLENLMRTYNNLGATLNRISETGGETAKRSQALAYLTRSSEYFDRLSRDQESFVRSESKNLSVLNTRSILYPDAGFNVEIYRSISRDMNELEF